jgi:small redox-active disulfide protein 2
MEIKILGTGCTNCKNLEKATYNAVAELNILADISKVEDIQQIMSYGIMRTPALVVDGKVIVYGRVPSVSEIKEMLLNTIN